MSRAIIDDCTLFLSPVFELPRQAHLYDLIDLVYAGRIGEEGGRTMEENDVVKAG